MSTNEVDRDLTVAAQLPPDLMLLKMENESIFAAARIRPRNSREIVAQLKDLIDAYPAAADEAIYVKPVGTVTEVTCVCGIKYEVVSVDKGTVCPDCEAPAVGGRGQRSAQIKKVKKFAEGLSIRAAESIRSVFGYTRLATTTEILPDGSARITGVLVDYAAGNVTSDERIVSPWYKSRNGQMTRTPEDRFNNVVIKAEKAKLRRDVILDSTPAIVKALFRDECEKKLCELVAPEVIEQKIIPAFASHGISPEQLDGLIGKPHALGWSEEDRLQCRKILTALKSGETTARDLLDEPQSAAPKSRVGTSPLNDPPKESEPPHMTPGEQQDAEFAEASAKEQKKGGDAS